MKVSEQEESLILVLQPHAIGEGAHVIAEMEGVTGRPVAGKYSLASLAVSQLILPNQKTPAPRGEGFSRCHPNCRLERHLSQARPDRRDSRGMPWAYNGALSGLAY